MQIVRDLAGYSMGRSDLVRRAMSKKKASVMEQERQNFIHGIIDAEGNILVNGAVRNGVGEAAANKIFDEMMDFASYAFNKSHAAAYAVVAYQTAWLKCYYPVEFMAALLNSFLGSSGKVSQYVHECKAMNIEVLSPDINESDIKFTVVNGKIRFGLAAVKNVGENAVRSIILERENNGSFKSFRDYCERMDGRDINKRCVESLIKSGSFDSLGVFRSRLMAVFEKMIDNIQQNKKRNLEGQLSIFEVKGRSLKAEAVQEEYPDIKEFPSKMLLSMEKEMLGLYISGHPLSEYENEINTQVTLFSSDLNIQGADEENLSGDLKGLSDGMPVSVGGIIVDKKTKTTRNNSIMAFVTLEDLFGTMEVIVFPATLERYARFLEADSTVLISGRLSVKEEEQPKIICEEIKPLQNSKARKLYLKLENRKDEAMGPLLSLLKYFSGPTPVSFYDSDRNPVKVDNCEYRVYLNDVLLSELKQRLGEDNVKLK